MNSGYSVPDAQWGNQIQFETAESAQYITELIQFQKLILNYLRTGEMMQIKNNQIVGIRIKIYNLIIEQQKQTFKDFYLLNIQGLVNEFSSNLDFVDDEQYLKLVSQKWISLKQFIFWMTFFFQNLEESKNVYVLYSQAFSYLKENFFERHQEQILKSIKNLIDIERNTFKTQEFHDLNNLVQIILISGIKNLMISKSIDDTNNQLDILFYHSNESKQLSPNEYYHQHFEIQMIRHLEFVYTQLFNDWSSKFNTPEYVEISLSTLLNEDLICNSYYPFSKRQFLDSIEFIVIIKYSKQLVQCETHGAIHMFKNQRYKQLRQLFVLFKRVPKYQRQQQNQEEEKKENQKKNNNQQQKPEKQEDFITQKQFLQQSQYKHPIEELKEVFFEYIKTQGEKINKNLEINKNPILYCQKVIELKDEIDNILLNSFYATDSKGDYEFTLKKDDAFKYIFLSFDNSARFLSVFCDQYLNSDTAKQFTDDNILNFIGQIKTLIHYINDKDLFFSEYQRLLSYRLLSEKVYNIDYEKQIITCFKMDHGKTTTKSMEQMIGDMSGQKETQRDFLNYLKEENLQLSISDFSVIVLQKSSWPLGGTNNANLPANNNVEPTNQDLQLIKVNNIPYMPQFFDKCLNVYKSFYKKIKGEKLALEWFLQEGQAQIDFTNKKKNNYQFLVSTYQMIILLTFNQKEEYKLTEICEITNIPKREVEKNLIHFYKSKLIEIDPPLPKENIKLNTSHAFKINDNFESKSKRSNLIFKKKALIEVENQKTSTDNLKKERECSIDAAIVRIMKSRKTVDFNSLITETLSLIRLFKPDVPSIKQRIESLIERDYLMRDPNEKAKFIYKP